MNTTLKSIQKGKGNLLPPSQQQKRLSISKDDGKRKSHDSATKCHFHRTRNSVDDLQNPLDDPKAPMNYNQPFRRNFRYFGYPKDLNLHLNTPPRVKSWGPALEEAPRVELKRKPFKLTKDKSFDPYWIGRLMKSNLLLQNPGLIPIVEKKVSNLGEEKVVWVHPDFEHTDCTSELYFPLSEKSRKGFCRINKITQEIVDKEVHDYKVQNRTIVKTKRLEGEVRKTETEIGIHKPPGTIGKKSKKKSNFSITDFRTRTPESLFYNQRTIAPVLKTYCIPENYPGMNVQPYSRPTPDDDDADNDVVKLDETPITGVVRIPDFESSNVPDEVWSQLSKVRVRKDLLRKRQRKAKRFKTFGQLELRNQVLRDSRMDFVDKLKTDVYTPLPAELFMDNRDMVQPSHDYIENDEFPPQGPFWWREERESAPTPEEIKIVDDFIQEQKKRHTFTHHLPGLLYIPRHPFPPVDLDWIEPGTETQETTQARKTPVHLHDMPEFFVELEPKRFQEKFEAIVSEGAKDLLGPELYDMYRKKQGIQSPQMSKQESAQEILKEMVPMKKKKVRRRVVKINTKPTELSAINEEEDEDEEGEEEEEEKANEPEEDEYRLDEDLDELAVEEFPYPDVRFSSIEFPKSGIPSGLKDDLKFFKKLIDQATPISKEKEEPVIANDDDSSTNSETENEPIERQPKESKHDALSHLQVLYQEAVKHKYKSMHRHPKTLAELEPPTLKNIFLMDDYNEDIDSLLQHNENIPTFLQLF